ncbi:mucin-2-like [Oppia nitens]|uniref:mucin-2-like n=1 Tax=Oppia nitens TaxID=1686743 RepID=UPI0023DA212C|nr:mucin-2-like [Oppia nitens]
MYGNIVILTTLLLLTQLLTSIQVVLSQSAGNVSPELTEEQLAEELERRITQNVVKLAATDQLNSEIVTNRSRAYLSCESGEMIVKINFSEPFRGIGYSDYDRTSPCKFYGDGNRYYEMRLPLKGCGTKQEAPRLFINNIILRFHRTLELEEDEIKTIVCRYPPPLAPPPPSISAPILEIPPPPPVPIAAKLSEVELLLIISALLFLTLLLLGIGMAYYCLKRRNIKVVRKRKFISSPPTELTIEPVHIPRVAVSTSSSEYPSSEEISVISDTSSIRRDHYSYENQAFIPEPYPMDVDRDESIASLPVPMMAKPNITKLDLLSTFYDTEHLTDTDVYNTRHLRTTTQLFEKPPTPMASSIYGSIPDNDMWSHSELEDLPVQRPYVRPPKLSVKNIDDYYLTTQYITDVDENVVRNDRLAARPPMITTKNTDDLYLTEGDETDINEDITRYTSITPTKPKITSKTTDDLFINPEDVTDITEDVTTHRRLTYPKPVVTAQTTDDYYRTTDRQTTELIDDTTTRQRIVMPEPTSRGPTYTQQDIDDRYVDVSETTEVTDDTSTRKLVKYPIPKYLIHTTDDTFITNISETETIEHITANDRQEPPLPPPLPSLLPPKQQQRPDIPQIESTSTRHHKQTSKQSVEDWELEITKSLRELTGPQPTQPPSSPPSQPQQPQPTTTTTTTTTMTTRDDYTSYEETKITAIYEALDNPPPSLSPQTDRQRLTPDVRQRFRTLVETDDEFRTLIVESNTVEEYTSISRMTQYESIFESETWITIIEVLSTVTVVEYVPKLPTSRPRPSIISDDIPFDFIRSRRTSHTGSIVEVRSLTEEDVTFARTDSFRYRSSGIHMPTRIPRISHPYLTRTLLSPVSSSVASPPPPLVDYWSPDSSSRPYSPDIDALSLALPTIPTTGGLSTTSYTSYGRSQAYNRLARVRQTLDRTSTDMETVKSVTEKQVRDWKR